MKSIKLSSNTFTVVGANNLVNALVGLSYKYANRIRLFDQNGSLIKSLSFTWSSISDQGNRAVINASATDSSSDSYTVKYLTLDTSDNPNPTKDNGLFKATLDTAVTKSSTEALSVSWDVYDYYLEKSGTIIKNGVFLSLCAISGNPYPIHSLGKVVLYDNNKNVIKALTGSFSYPYQDANAFITKFTAYDTSNDSYTVKYLSLFPAPEQNLSFTNSFYTQELSTAKTKGSSQTLKVEFTLAVIGSG